MIRVWIFTKENEKAPHAVLFEQQLSVEGWHHYVIYWGEPAPAQTPGHSAAWPRRPDLWGPRLEAARRNWDARKINKTREILLTCLEEQR